MIQSVDKTIYWVIIHSNETVLLDDNNQLLRESDVSSFIAPIQKRFELGHSQNSEYRAAEIETESVPSQFHFIPLRIALSLLPQEQYGIVVKAHAIIQWNKNHQFCGRCGAKTIEKSVIFERMCSACQLSFFPRISPSIIVCITQADHILMARSAHFPAGIYGLIAGFVEAGETLEEAVHREVYEEVGLKIKNLSYIGSQPWPFPDALMLAFTADYESGDICIDKSEIEEAGWYRYDNLPGRPSVSVSIASALVDSFIEKRMEYHHTF